MVFYDRNIAFAKSVVQRNKNQNCFVLSECALGKFNRLMRRGADADSVQGSLCHASKKAAPISHCSKKTRRDANVQMLTSDTR